MLDVDITKIDQLLSLFETSSLSRLTLRSKDTLLTFERKIEPGVSSSPPAASSSVPSATPAPEVDLEELHTIESPIVGTFYLTPAVDAPPYVRVGSTVAAGDILCTIEAMKLMNHLEAEFACEIVEILARPEQMVEYGTPLFQVRRL